MYILVILRKVNLNAKKYIWGCGGVVYDSCKQDRTITQ